ncbi:hypothetical protein cyc_03235 [Cyclospora cayetanensis]|uniref:Uncharacterized protein n=1 Tax=Cyclospora cayetanensis TaxID=88456 RepID=A0A1D3CV84_9EIME|nr:hypothetical protein cyc_03235 [Cyclospora cayetanensis]
MSAAMVLSSSFRLLFLVFLCFYCCLPQWSHASPPPAAKAGAEGVPADGELSNSQHIEMASAQLTTPDLLLGLGGGITHAAHEAGLKEPIIGKPDIKKTVQEIAVAKEVVFTNRGHDETKLLQSSVHHEFPNLDKDEIEIQLDLSDPTEKSVFEDLLKKGVSLVNYHRHGSFLRESLQSKGSFFQAIEKQDETAEDLAQSMLYRSISVVFQHSKSDDVKHFLSLKFWEDEETATKTMEDILAKTNQYVSIAFMHIANSLEKKLTAVFSSFLEFAATKSPEALGVLICEHETQFHPWLKDLVFLHDEIMQFCGSKPIYCKIVLREIHKMRSEMKQALAVEEFKMMLRGILASLNVIKEDALLTKDDNGESLGGTSFVWSDLSQFLAYAMIRISIVSLTYALTHPAVKGKVPYHLISRLSTDCYYLAEHHDVQNKIKKAWEGSEEAKTIKRLDKYFAGYISTYCNLLAIKVYTRTMEEKALSEEIKLESLEESLPVAFKAMFSWRNTIIVPELQKDHMEQPSIKIMHKNVILEAMNKALKNPVSLSLNALHKLSHSCSLYLLIVRAYKGLEAIATFLSSRCSNAEEVPKVEPRELEAFLRDFSFDEAPLVPLATLVSNMCYAYYMHEGMIRHLSGTAEDTTPYAIGQAFAKVLSASQVLITKGASLETTSSGFKCLKECVEKARADVVGQFSLIPEMLHFDMQAGVCDLSGLKKLKLKYDIVIRALTEIGKQPELLTKVQEKEKIALTKFMRLAIDEMKKPSPDKAALELHVKKVLAYEAVVHGDVSPADFFLFLSVVAKECNAIDELELMKELRQYRAAHKEAEAGGGTGVDSEKLEA